MSTDLTDVVVKTTATNYTTKLSFTAEHIDWDALARLTTECHGQPLHHGRWLAWCHRCTFLRPLAPGERR